MYICKIASPEEMERKWDYEIKRHPGDGNWVIWKQQFLESAAKGHSLSYYGILDGKIICEATAALHPENIQDSEGLVGDGAAYLSAFRTVEEYQGQGYFSKLMRFMLDDLKRRGIVRITLGVEPAEEKNKRIYAHYGFTEYIKSAADTYPDGTVVQVEYYGRSL